MPASPRRKKAPAESPVVIGKVPKQRAAGPYRANEKARSHTRPLACSHLIVLCPAGHHSDEIPTGNSFQASIRPRRGIAWSENNLCPRLAHTSSSHPAPIPAWRSEALTLAEARREGLGGWLPLEETIPAGFDFDNAWVELGQGRDYLSAYWCKGYDYIDVTVYRRTEGGYFPEADLTDGEVTAQALEALGNYVDNDAGTPPAGAGCP